MATARVRRGRDTEEAVAQWLRDHGWHHAERNPANLSGRDINGIAGLGVEVKARRDFNPGAWARQATKNAGTDLPLVVMRPDGMGLATIASWPVFLTLADVTQLLKDGGYQT